MLTELQLARFETDVVTAVVATLMAVKIAKLKKPILEKNFCKKKYQWHMNST